MEAADVRARVVALEHKAQAYESRMTVMEQWRSQMDIFNARRDEQFTNMMGKFSDLEGKLDKLSGGISRLLWTIGSAVLAAVVVFVLKGGLNAPA